MEEDDDIYQKVREELESAKIFDVAKSDNHYVDVNMKEVNKSRGVKDLAEYLNIDLSEIICIGDSITKGKVWNEYERRPYITEKSYPSFLKDLMNIDVDNDGICDITSEQMLQRIRSNMSFEEGSAVIVEIGGNDCNPNWKDIKKDPDGEHDAIIPLEKFKYNLIKIIDIIKNCGAFPILSTQPPLDPDRYYNLLRRIFGDGIKRWIDRNGGIFRWQERYSDIVKITAQRLGIYLIDTRKAFLDSLDYRSFMSFDGIHPNEKGYELIGAVHEFYHADAEQGTLQLYFPIARD
jgi:lysophospholipase L1-like esterase